MALASAACGSGDGAHPDPDLDIDSSDKGALLHHADAEASGSCQLPDGPRTVHQMKGPPGSLQGGCVPTWTQEQLNDGFTEIRDRRMITLPEDPDFDRRIPWLAADNGCEDRAEAASYYLKSWNYPTPYYARVLVKLPKRLILRTDNEPSGAVRWVHHVAPVVRVGGRLMILDPAVEPKKPLPIEEWLPRFSVAGEFDVALCRDHAVGDGCFDAAPVEPSPPHIGSNAGLHMRLTAEWGVQEILGRDPYRVLGDCPPWVECEAEPTPDVHRPPTIRHFRTDRLESSVFFPIYVIGDNFVEGVTTVRVTGNGVDESVPIESYTLRSLLLAYGYDPGEYQVTAANGAHVSQPVVMTISEF
ncbi:protein-glutamine glutaminase family protein [Sorangium sp. So ce887]|uniref:protein-glutamine glutaminase family protein n=1 Tax=Sorangium sp. So ce887 TaxID=3133324 RepID=UPI003F60330C